jgi:hypothetical protein
MLDSSSNFSELNNLDSSMSSNMNPLRHSYVMDSSARASISSFSSM